MRHICALITGHFSHIPESIKMLETHGLRLNKSIQMIIKISKLNSELPETFLCEMKETFDNTLHNNAGFEPLCQITK